MDFLNENDIKTILRNNGYPEVSNMNWLITDYSNNLVGYLGEHLSLKISFELNGALKNIKYFVKCLPRFEKWKADFLKDLIFFDKEYVMLGDLFKKFPEHDGSRRYRPKALLLKKDLFVFEDVTELGYKMPCQRENLTWPELKATISAMARFHSQSYIFEERKSKSLGRSYHIWEDYSEYLEEPAQGQSWRDTGMKAIIDVLKVFSKYRTKDNFTSIVDKRIPELFRLAEEQIKPSTRRRNVVVHRDVWSNNIFLKQHNDGNIHALIVDFQTVVYADPMIDLASMICFNTKQSFREEFIDEIINIYHDSLIRELIVEGIDVGLVPDKKNLREHYNESMLFGLTQAAIIIPIVTFDEDVKKNIFSDADKSYRFNIVSRSQEFIDFAKVDETYRVRICEIFDELLERFVFN
ncbi:unnamed protein product [Danaus chrysippus]|uniref:(African queen) hypothetical protein n=1 Tax=Danaus chrysippus TaxID=151541 RepID=A0A8J2QLB9_9NEOP|nr:unnamed protein product [Danaus chrysippus]